MNPVHVLLCLSYAGARDSYTLSRGDIVIAIQVELERVVFYRVINLLCS